MKRLSLLPLFLFAGGALASGLSKPVNIGPKAIGMGGAFVGIADDPSAIYHNPAGITQLEGHSFLAGMDALITDETYTPPGGAAEKAKTEFLPVPQLGYATNHFKPLSFGLGLFFPHGNGGKYSDTSATLTNPLEGRIYSMEIAPAAAWQIVPEFSIGMTVRIVRVSETLKGQILSPPPSLLVLDDLDLAGWGVGASAGVLYKPCKFFSLGANYRSQINVNLDGDAAFTPGGTFNASIDQTLPTLVTAGVGVKPMDGLTLGLSYDWERNSEIDSGTLEVEGGLPVPVTFNFNDSHTIHFGAEYWVLPMIAVRGGYAKDLNESIPNSYMNRVVGDIAANEISFGLAYNWTRYTFGATWNARFGERDVPATGFAPGHYEAFIQSISLAVGFSI